MTPGLHRDVPRDKYLALPEIGSTQLEWLSHSPKYFRWMMDHPQPPSREMDLGTALHARVLEPALFERTYVQEPDPDVIAPGMAKPRASKAYREAIDAIEAAGRTVLTREQWDAVQLMAESLAGHEFVAEVLARAQWREMTALFDRNGRGCRARFDAIGGGLICDLKTTRALDRFNPYAFTDRGYHIQAAHYRYGARACGLEVLHVFLGVVESVPPYDAACFTIDEESMECGDAAVEELLATLTECEKSGVWPGGFPGVQVARVTERELELVADGEGA